MTNVSIITIGDELLIGQVVDTNSAWMARMLNFNGFGVTRRVAVGDNRESIWAALDEESQKADIILITGGLGPTADDITKPLLCEYFNGKMIVDEWTKNHVTNLFEQILKKPLTERNLKQAEVPDTCEVIQNHRGTAPGMAFEKEGKLFISMPGVPYEMQGMMEKDIIPLLQKKYTPGVIEHRTVMTYGIGESNLADLLSTFEASLPHSVKLAYLPNHGLVRLRLTSIGKLSNGQNIDNLYEELKLVVKDYIVTTEDEPMENIVMNLLLKHGKTMSTAESCTGGYIAHLITSIPGSSAIFKGSVVSYSNEAKERLLHVNNETLEKQGAVSEETVKQMAAGALSALHTDYAVAVSGIMGPDGGTPDKPVGTVWICAAGFKNTVTKKFTLRYDRKKNIEVTAVNALNMLRALIKEETG